VVEGRVCEQLVQRDNVARNLVHRIREELLQTAALALRFGCCEAKKITFEGNAPEIHLDLPSSRFSTVANAGLLLHSVNTCKL
jgi:hypothetical protein